MGTVFLISAFMVSLFVAMLAPRAGFVLGALLFVLGTLPMIWIAVSRFILGVHPGEGDGMILTMGLYFLSAPGIMMLALCLIFVWSDR